MSNPFDPGLQPERTALAWRRTALALLAGSLVATRILPEVVGAWAVIPGLVGVAAAAVLLSAIHFRYRRHHGRLTDEGDRSPVAGGRLVALTALFLFASAVVTAVFIGYAASTGGSAF